MYSYTDMNLPANQMVYYRLKLVDLDGSVTYSKIRPVQIDTHTLLSQLIPNPVHGKAQLLINNPIDQSLTVSVLSLTGRQLYQLTYNLKKGVNTIELDCTTLSPGVYTVIVTDGITRQIEKMVVE